MKMQIRNSKFEIRSTKSELQKPRAKIQNQKSKTCLPAGKVRNILWRSRDLVTSLLLTPYCLLFTVGAAFASSAGSEGEHHSVFEAYFWPVINFLILIGLLYILLKKMDIRGYFKKRTELIEKSLQEAREAKELAQKALEEVEEKLKVKDREIEAIIDAAHISGAKEKAKLEDEGEKLKARILEQAKTNIDYEVKTAKEEIKAEAVDIAMELAEKKLKEKLTKEEQLKLLEESLRKIEEKR
jgi:F-type H+-transporting ATPase subunit b